MQGTFRNKCGMTMCLNISQSTSFRPSECGVPEGAMPTKKNKVYQRCKATQSEEYNVISKGLVLMQVTFLNPEASGRDDDVLKY